MENTRILGIAISNRQEASIKVQNLLTKFGCSIKTRLGLHEVSNSECSTSGLVLLELTGEQGEAEKLEQELRKIEGIQVNKMDFRL